MYIALLKTKNAERTFSKLSFNDAIHLLNDLISTTQDAVEYAHIMNDPEEGSTNLVASLRVIK